MPKKMYISDDGTIIRETIEEIDILEGLRELAEDKLRLMRDKIALEQRIEKMQQEHSNQAREITERYNAVVKQLKPAVADAIKEKHLVLNNLLAQAFPSDFEKVVHTVVADEGQVSEDPKKYYNKKDPRSKGDTVKRVG